MRCFIGIDLPNSLKKSISKFIDDVDNLNLFYGKFVESENLHLSLKFLGELSEEDVSNVEKSLSTINFNPFKFSIKDIGSFPNKNFVKVLWLGVGEGKKEILELNNKIEENLPQFSNTYKVFTPHITLGRIKNISNKDMLSKFFDKNKNISFGEVNVSSFYLFKSTLTSNGPIYEKIKKFELKDK